MIKSAFSEHKVSILVHMKTKEATHIKPRAVYNTQRFFSDEVATEKLCSEQKPACVLAPPVRRRSWCTASPTFRWATRSSRRRCASWSRWWRGWRTATRSWPRTTRSSATRPGCKRDPQPLPHPTPAPAAEAVHSLVSASLLCSNQQLAQKEKILKEEVEEMKVTLSCTEEGRARASAHSKHVVSRQKQLKTCMLLCHFVYKEKYRFIIFMLTDAEVVVKCYSCICHGIFFMCSVVVTVFNASFQEKALIWFSHHADAV